MPRMAPGFQAGPPDTGTGSATGASGAGISNPFAAQPSFAQRRTNMQNLYGPGGQGMAMNFAPSGGGAATGSGGGAGGGPRMDPMEPAGSVYNIPRPQSSTGSQSQSQGMIPRGQGGMSGGGMSSGPRMLPPPPQGMGQQGPSPWAQTGQGPGQGQGSPFSGGLPPGLQQLLQQPGFMEMLMRYAGGMGQQQMQRQPPTGTGGPSGPYRPPVF